MSLVLVKDGIICSDTAYQVDRGGVYSVDFMPKLFVSENKDFALGYVGEALPDVDLFMSLITNTLKEAKDIKSDVLKIFNRYPKSSFILCLKNKFYTNDGEFDYSTFIAYGTGVYVATAKKNSHLSAVELIKKASGFCRTVGGSVSMVDTSKLKEFA